MWAGLLDSFRSADHGLKKILILDEAHELPLPKEQAGEPSAGGDELAKLPQLTVAAWFKVLCDPSLAPDNEAILSFAAAGQRVFRSREALVAAVGGHPSA